MNKIVDVTCRHCGWGLGKFRLSDVKEGRVKCKKCETLTQTASIGISCKECKKTLGSISKGEGFTAFKCDNCQRFECYEISKEEEKVQEATVS